MSSNGCGSPRRAGWLACACVGLIAVVVAGCGGTPGGGSKTSTTASTKVSTDIAKAGKVTLHVWDYEVSSPPRAKSLDQLDKSFMAKYPNVTVKREVTDFNTYNKQAKLQLSSSDAPCVAEGGQGYSLDGPLIQARLLRPVDDYAKAYGWSKGLSEGVLRQFRFDDAGQHFGTGKLYGISPAGEIGGWFVNRKLLTRIGGQVPTDFPQFEALLAKAKAAGVTPILLGNLDKWPGSQILSAVANQQLPGDSIDGLVYSDPKTGWNAEGWSKAADIAARWAKQGYIKSGFNGLGYDDAVTRFANGGALLVQSGPWETDAVSKKLGKDVGFFVTPPMPGQPLQATGALSGPFHITSSCKTPDVAAAYIDWLVGPEGQRVFGANGDLPVRADLAHFASDSAQEQVRQAFVDVLEKGHLTPYVDWTTPTTGDVLYGGMQSILAGREAPSKMFGQLDRDRSQFLAGQE
jgi:raffinose/stachyose/melibiose transport system substrate-binding protein